MTYRQSSCVGHDIHDIFLSSGAKNNNQKSIDGIWCPTLDLEISNPQILQMVVYEPMIEVSWKFSFFYHNSTDSHTNHNSSAVVTWKNLDQAESITLTS